MTITIIAISDAPKLLFSLSELSPTDGATEVSPVAVVDDCETVVAGSVCELFCVAFVSPVTEFCAGTNDAGADDAGRDDTGTGDGSTDDIGTGAVTG